MVNIRVRVLHDKCNEAPGVHGPIYFETVSKEPRDGYSNLRCTNCGEEITLYVGMMY